MIKVSIIFFTLIINYPSVIGRDFNYKQGNTLNFANDHQTNDSIKKKETAVSDYIGFYQKYISGIRGHECPMYPSCSNFGLKSFKESNFAKAFLLTSDRLLRCGHDHDYYPLTLQNNGFKFIDFPAYQSPPLDLYYSRNQYCYAYSDTIKNDSIIQFIKVLINKGHYSEALLEISRFEFYKGVFDRELFINKIICLKALGEHEKALLEFEMYCPEIHKKDPELLYQIALINYKLGNIDRSLYFDSLSLSYCKNCIISPKLNSLNGIILANKYNWEGAFLSYEALYNSDTTNRSYKANLGIISKAMKLKNKSPFVASTLSIIPGLGYAYTGHKQTAITAFLVNSLLAYATYTSLKTDNYGMAILTGVFNLSFYIGNIYGSSKSAKRYNLSKRKNFITQLEYNSIF
jgi:putative component of membrane protein insertase Oxa1/YidC/SpoIIIJ protein YidD